EPRLQQPEYRIGAAQRLKAVEAKARRLILVPERSQAERPRQARQRVERRRRVARPGGDLRRRGVEPRRRQNVAERAVGQTAVQVQAQRHGRGLCGTRFAAARREWHGWPAGYWPSP